MATNNGLNLNTTTPLSPLLGGTGASMATALPVLIQANYFTTGLDTGVANAYVAIVPPGFSTIPTTGAFYWIGIDNANSGPSTLNLNSSGPKPIVDLQGNALVGGELITPSFAQFLYNGVSYVLQNSALQDVNPPNGASNFVVDAAGGAQYTTIQSAVTAALATIPTATSPALIYVWAGTYTENITLPDYIYLKGAGYGSVFIVGHVAYNGTASCRIEDIFIRNSGGPSSFTVSSTGAPTLINCQLQNTGGICFEGTAFSHPVLQSVEINAGTGAQQFNLSGACIAAWTNALGTYTDTASSINTAALVVVGGTFSGAFALVAGVLDVANCAAGVFSQNLAFSAMDNASVTTIINSQIESDAPATAVFTGPGVLVADCMSLSGTQQAIDSFVQVQGHVDYLGYVARANNFVPGISQIATGSTGGTTNVTSIWGSLIEFTGVLTQICVLPSANQLYLGQSYTIVNKSTQAVTVQDGSAAQLFIMYPNSSVVVTCTNNVGTAGTWIYNYSPTLPTANGQILIGSGTGFPTPTTLTAGAGMTITNGSNSITLSSTGGGIGWQSVAGTTQAMAVDVAYVPLNAGLTTFTLPASAAFGTVVNVTGYGIGGWTIAQNAAQNIQVGTSTTTTGVAGSISSQHASDSINLVCVSADKFWVCVGAPQGTLTIV